MKVITVKNNAQAIEFILEEYKNSDVCIGELFVSIEIRGLSIEDVVKVYAELYEQIEVKDCFIVDDDEDDKWKAYLNYLVNWAFDHQGKEFAGMTPACYEEFLDCECQEV